MKLIDTHAHLNLAEFADDYEKVINDSLERGVFVINVGVNYASSQRADELARQFGEGVYCAIGLHPENIEEEEKPAAKEAALPEHIKEADFDGELYRELARSAQKIVALGETGLDYLRLPKNAARAEAIRSKQKEVFKKQLALAKELGLPVIVHSRLAHEDTMAVLRDFTGASGRINGVMHCFSGSEAEAREIYDLGMYFGLNGIIFKLDIAAAVAQLPLDRILLETDCPYLSPIKEVRRNEPRYVSAVAERVAQIRRDSVDTIVEAANANAKKLFGI
ncbi:MAG: TatD family hydrolase [Candidatus Pacebacteria bacterium]|jgi:TatD DNase family protein|nr:TatD family hydrolase [Candidatus Paceibacterota bacterium]